MIIQYVKSIIEKNLRCRIFRSTLPRGADFFFDLDRDFGLGTFSQVFDVGANIGLTAALYLKYFANATIYSFEPVQVALEKLKHNIGEHPRLKSFNVALGSENGTATININPDLQVSSIRTQRPGDVSKQILLQTVDSICQKLAIAHIDLLKIDTEGYENQVLLGAEQMLKNQQIDLVFLEASDRPDDPYFSPFPVINQHLRQRGYELYGFYDQQPYWDGRKAMLYFNAAWVSQTRAGQLTA